MAQCGSDFPTEPTDPDHRPEVSAQYLGDTRTGTRWGGRIRSLDPSIFFRPTWCPCLLRRYGQAVKWLPFLERPGLDDLLS